LDVTFLASERLIEELAALDPKWAEYRHGKPISQRSLADCLKQFGIQPTRNKTATARGYYRDSFEDAFSRYLLDKASNRQNPHESGPGTPFSIRQTASLFDASKRQPSPMNPGLFDALTVQAPSTRAEADTKGPPNAEREMHPDFEWRDPEEREQ
jgi:hypothetical protein